jgi:hypothetical protein
MLSPDGKVADIPQGRVADAKNGGYKLAVDMIAPDGKTATIPYERVGDAMSQGGYRLPGSAPKPAGSYQMGDEIGANTQGAGRTEAATDVGALGDEISNGAKAVDQWSQGTGVAKGVTRAAIATAKMPAQTLHAITAEPENDDEREIYNNGVESPVGHIPGIVALPLWRLVGAPLEEADKKSQQYEQMATQEQNPEIKKQLLDASRTYKMGSVLPLVGPLAANLAERGAYGTQGASKLGSNGKGGFLNNNSDLLGATAEALTYGIAPKVTEELTKAGVGAIKNAPDILPAEETPGEMADRRAAATPEPSGNPSLWGTRYGPNAIPGVTDQESPSLGQRITQSAANATTKGAVAASKGITKGAAAATKYVGVPVAKGIVSGLTDVVKEDLGNLSTNATNTLGDLKNSVVDAVTNGKGALVDRISSALENAGDVGKSLVPKADEIAASIVDKMANGASTLADNVEEILRGHLELGQDTIGRALDNIATKTTDYLSQRAQDLGLTPDDIKTKVQNVVDKVRDEYTYHFNRPPEVSGGSFDADESFGRNMQDELAGRKYNSRLAELAYTEPAAADLKNALTKGSTHGGGENIMENRLRRIPGLGADVFADDANVTLKAALESALTNGAYYSNYGSRLTEILGKTIDDVQKSGNLNLKQAIKQINEGLSDNRSTASPNRFKNYDAGKLVGDDTETAKLWRDALQEADEKISRTTGFGGPYASTTALGMSGVLSGFAAGHPVVGMVIGLGADIALKAMVRQHFLNPMLPGDSLLIHALSSIPQPAPGTLLGKAAARSAAATGSTVERSPVFKAYTPEQKAAALESLKSANQKVKEWWGKVKDKQGK